MGDDTVLLKSAFSNEHLEVGNNTLHAETHNVAIGFHNGYFTRLVAGQAEANGAPVSMRVCAYGKLTLISVALMQTKQRGELEEQTE